MSILARFGKKTETNGEPDAETDEFVPPDPGAVLFLDFYNDSPSNVIVSLEATLRAAGTKRWLIEGLRPRDGGRKALPAAAFFFELPAIVSYADESGMRRFESRLLEARAAKLDKLLSLAAPADVERIQRRRHYRLKIGVAARYRLLTSDGVSHTSLPGEVLDLSEGGMRLVVHRPTKPMQYVLVEEPLGKGQEPGEVMAEVLACERSGGAYTLRLRFDNDKGLALSEAKRALIARFVSEQQRVSITKIKQLAAKST